MGENDKIAKEKTTVKKEQDSVLWDQDGYLIMKMPVVLNYFPPEIMKNFRT